MRQHLRRCSGGATCASSSAPRWSRPAAAGSTSSRRSWCSTSPGRSASTTPTVGLLYALLLVGAVVGPILAGILSDRFGRRRTLVAYYLLSAVGIVAFVAAGANLLAARAAAAAVRHRRVQRVARAPGLPRRSRRRDRSATWPSRCTSPSPSASAPSGRSSSATVVGAFGYPVAFGVMAASYVAAAAACSCAVRDGHLRAIAARPRPLTPVPADRDALADLVDAGRRAPRCRVEDLVQPLHDHRHAAAGPRARRAVEAADRPRWRSSQSRIPPSSVDEVPLELVDASRPGSALLDRRSQPASSARAASSSDRDAEAPDQDEHEDAVIARPMTTRRADRGTHAPCQQAAATTRPTTTGGRIAVAKARTSSWLLSPNSATKIAPNAMSGGTGDRRHRDTTAERRGSEPTRAGHPALESAP